MAKEQENRNLQNLPACIGEFIRLVVKKMRYRRKVRRDVQDELTVHFEDELKDCKSDEDRRAKAQQLITDFGDVKLLAVLLRRAKKRCRPLWRTIVARAFQAVAILIVCFVVYTIWFMTGKPIIRVDYLAQLNQMSRPQLLDQDNAWPHYQRAISLYIEPHERISTVVSRWRQESKDRLRFGHLGEDSQSKIRRWVNENEFCWNQLTSRQKQLLQDCFQDGLVPCPFRYSPGGEYRLLDSVVEFIILKTESAAGEEPVFNFSQGVVEFDPNEPRDAEMAKWFEQSKPSQDLERGIEVGALKYWIENPPPPAESLLDRLLPFQRKLVAKWIEDNKPAWQEFAAGSSKSYCYREYESGCQGEGPVLFTILMPELSGLRQLARLGTWQARVAISRGDTQQAIQACLAVTRAGSHWQGKGTLVEQLVGLGMVSLGHDEILDIVATQELSAAELTRLQQQLVRMYPQGYCAIDIESERLGFLDVVQYVFTDGGPGGGHLVPSRWPQLSSEAIFTAESELEIFMPLSTAASMVHARRDDTVATFNELFDKLTEITQLSPYQRHMRNLRSDDFVSAVPKYRYFLIQLLVPAVDRVSEIGYRGKVSHQATLTILAAKRWRLEKNTYPATLDELLAAGYLKERPMDPYSDKPLIYKRTDGGFALYSVGPNFTEEGGEPGKDRQGRARMWQENGDTVFWPLPEAEAKS